MCHWPLFFVLVASRDVSSGLSAELPLARPWSWLWPDERANQLFDWPALVRFSLSLGYDRAFFSALLRHRCFWSWRSKLRDCWRGGLIRRGDLWQYSRCWRRRG